MSENAKVQPKKEIGDDPMNPVPLDQRQHWGTPAMIFGGLEFSITILMVGSTLVNSFGFKKTIPIVLFTFLVLTWIGNSISGFIGAKTGLASTIIARQPFGAQQAKFIIAMVVGVISLGWWSIQTSLTGNAICAMLGIDYTADKMMWTIITIIVGLTFAIPSIIGYSSMKWTDMIAVPAGLLIVVGMIFLSLKNHGWSTIWNYQPPNPGAMSFAAAVTFILGMNVSQWVISADYTRYAHPRVKDNVLIPFGIIGVGVPLVFVGAMMAIGEGTYDIVAIMIDLGFPLWGFLVLWLSAWTSQLVNNYSMGLSFSNILNIESNRGRAIVTFVSTLIALVVSLMGMMDHFMGLLTMAALIYPGIAGVIFTDFFMRKGNWVDKEGWNMVATLALVVNIGVGYLTTYIIPIGIPPLQSLIITGIFYYFGMKIKAKKAPDKFTDGMVFDY
ncbi:purine-cytosine permease family protein [Lutispora saccharofermentans]|uniref:Cytosine permease n=1 Tax=Lutispora saccharofermentans TaxID=3024236 RepID=A0ABT1NDS4_9FIRM|nr:cytosine permease [Lutispora saccharofermentans]MCQ1529403.1 cytosine permease [Lutispora saccharofermentans]